MKERKKRDWKQSEYKKLVRITEEDLKWLEANKHKKSRAGKLKEIIDFYKKNGSTKYNRGIENTLEREEFQRVPENI